MAIRITSNMVSNQTLSNLNKNRNTMSDLSMQSSTGRKINKASDDPVGTTYALRYRAELAATDQYKSNTDAAQSWLDYSDTLMQQSTDVMKRVKELTIQASTGTTDGSGLKAIKDELDELKKQLADVGNSQLTGRYVFNGEKFDERPYQLDSSTTKYSDVVTDTGKVTYGISEQISIGVSTDGNEFFGKPAEKDNAFAILERLSSAIDNVMTTGTRDYSAISGELENIDSRANAMGAVRSEVGAKTNRVELVSSRLDERELNVTDLQSKVEDADISEVMIKATTAQTIYQAALQTSASTMKLSLVNFLN
ncbi:flagellar hook-associated protein FlgL [Paenibacillus hunanensis]|uniref:Flagellar hook-associated protein 3 FlgL n=1 Tax=Paenibacillus hunanensis TaxID=539262 RepID=A0ABU1ITN5_9BACL|nr:flagellar hook-associated protein FlgL [Paenibacillus hunanensis]MDR6242619.1 flagellar hook-associated protein 3 FlgL [Paenibacillus hunanensis]GGJ01405.1 flagellar hook-associated protein 3 [Paenibacillus hunanensis]